MSHSRVAAPFVLLDRPASGKDPRTLREAYEGWEGDDGSECENCWVTGRRAGIREDARSGRFLCRECRGEGRRK
jgi:hypothetical protein